MIEKKVYQVTDFNKFCKKIELYDGTFFKLSNKIFRMKNIIEGESIHNFDELLENCIYKAIRFKLIELLSKKDYSNVKLLEKIEKYGYSNIYAYPIIEELKAKGYINEEEYCIDLIKSYSAKYGIYRIKNKLFEKGIQKEIIDKYLYKIELNSYDVILKSLRKYNEDDLYDYKSKQKIINKLLYRGFESKDINFAIEDRIYELKSDMNR